MATTQTKLVGFCLGNKTNYNATNYANHIWFDPTNKQILLNGIEYIPKKLSELVNDKNFLTSITKSMVEGVLTGNITSHTHTFASITSKPNTLGGYGITDAMYFYEEQDYLAARFNNTALATKAANTYIELWQSGAGWFKLKAGKFITIGGTSTQFLKGDGSLDSNTYALSSALGNYLPLTGGTLTGTLTCNGDYINMNNDSGSRGYRGFFNQSNSTSRASGSHIFMKGGGEALGTNSVSIGYQAYAGIRNKDSDATTYPYIAWQWMPTEKFSVDTTNSATLSGGEYYGFPLLPNEMVQWNIGGQNVIYENSSSLKELLVVIKASDADTGLVFGGKTTLPYRASKTLIAGKYIVGAGEYLKNITEYTINGVKYYQVIIYTWDTTAFPTNYDFTQQVKVMCATKVNNSNYSGASSYASGFASVASGYSSVASGYYSVASGVSSVASGNSSVASGNFSVASGYSSVASGNFSVASGYSSVASGDFSVVLARNGETMSSYQTIVGKFNAKVAGLFIIGNGTSDTARSNAFVVDDSGNVTAKYFSGYANAIGGEGIKVYAGLSNEINFGGTSSTDTIYFGYRSMDSRPTPTKYVFGANGTAILDGLARRLAYTSISENADINTYINEGVYSTASTSIMLSLVNAPTNRLNGEMRLEVISSSSSTTYIIQKFWSRDHWSGWKLHIRTTSSDGWTAWKEIALTDSSITGNAATATALTSSAGSTTQPIYFSNGKPVACSYTLGKSVPSNAVFTDTTYSVATASADGLMSAAMFNTEKVSSISVHQGAVQFEEPVRNHDIYVTYNKDKALNSDAHIAGGDVRIKIPNATKDYDGSMSYTDKRKLDKMPPTMFGATLVFYNNEILIDGTYGDYNLESGDATVDGYETIQENNHYITMVAFNITNIDLKDKLRDGFVKFGYSSKDNSTYETMRLLQSNFDGTGLYVEFIHATPIGSKSFWFDCIWEVYPI